MIMALWCPNVFQMGNTHTEPSALGPAFQHVGSYCNPSDGCLDLEGGDFPAQKEKWKGVTQTLMELPTIAPERKLILFQPWSRMPRMLCKALSSQLSNLIIVRR